jgi:hypothetical protein
MQSKRITSAEEAKQRLEPVRTYVETIRHEALHRELQKTFIRLHELLNVQASRETPLLVWHKGAQRHPWDLENRYPTPLTGARRHA